MKTLKTLGIVFAAVLLLALIGLAVVVSQFDGPRLKAEAVKLVQEKQQRRLKIDGEVKLSLWPNVGVSFGNISLSEQNSEQEFAAIDSGRLSLALMPLFSRRIVVNEVGLMGLRASLIKHKDGRLNIADLVSGGQAAKPGSAEAPAAPPGSTDMPSIDIAGVDISKAQITWRDEQSGSTSAISGLELKSGRVLADSASRRYSLDRLSLAVKGRSEAKDGKDSADLKLSLAGLEGKDSLLNIVKLDLELDATAKEATLKAELSSGLAVDFGKQTATLEKLVGSVELRHPRLPMKQIKLPFSGSLSADQAKQSVQGKLTTQLDASKIALSFGLAKAVPLALSFDLEVDRLNLDSYLPPPATTKPASETAAAPVAGDKLDFPALQGLAISGALRVGQFQVHNIKLEQLKLQLHLASGKLDIAPMSAQLYSGTVNGALSLNAKDNGLRLKQNLVGISIAPLLKDAADKDLLEGRGSVAMDLSTQGGTVAEMKKALAGSASLSLKDGAIKGINLAQSFREFKGRLAAKPDQVVQNKVGEKTDFSELSGTFKIAGGVAHNEDLAAKSPFLRLAGKGDLDIGQSRLNYLLKLSAVATAGGQGAADLEQLKGLTVPVRLSGPIDNPAWKIEFADLAKEAVQVKVEETKQKLQEKLQDRVGEKLKGLFGR